jgi:hypothetical protein
MNSHISAKKWQAFSKEAQILNTAAEFSRAKSWLIKNDKQIVKNCLQRALELIDLSIRDVKWKSGLKELLRFRDLLADFYIKENKDKQYFYNLYRTWLNFNGQTAKVRI